MKSIQQLLELDEKRTGGRWYMGAPDDVPWVQTTIEKGLIANCDYSAAISSEQKVVNAQYLAAMPDAIHHLRALVEKCRVYETALERIGSNDTFIKPAKPEKGLQDIEQHGEILCRMACAKAALTQGKQLNEKGGE